MHPSLQGSGPHHSVDCSGADTAMWATPPPALAGEDCAKRSQALALEARLSGGCVAPFMLTLGLRHELFYFDVSPMSQA